MAARGHDVTRSRQWFKEKAGRRDANHASIRDGLRKLGHFVVDCAGTGGGVPDLCVYARPNWRRIGSFQALAVLPIPTWLELKAGKGAEREAQIAWATAALNAGARVATVRSLGDALAAIGRDDPEVA